jgi:hypothetical protein
VRAADAAAVNAALSAEPLDNARLIDHLWRTWSPGLDVPAHVHEMYADPVLRANALQLDRPDEVAALALDWLR